MSLRSVLRCQARELAGGMCDWPSCERPGQELAHIRSIGMGGRPSADVIENCCWLCHTHSRMSDGEWTTRPEYVTAHNALFGEDWERRIPPSRLAFERAVALTARIAARRAGVEP
jgi:hypothetical protein